MPKSKAEKDTEREAAIDKLQSEQSDVSDEQRLRFMQAIVGVPLDEARKTRQALPAQKRGPKSRKGVSPSASALVTP